MSTGWGCTIVFVGLSSCVTVYVLLCVCNFYLFIYFGSIRDDSDLFLLRRHLLLLFPHRCKFSASDVMLSCEQLWAGLQCCYFSVFKNVRVEIHAIERFGNHE